MKRHLTFITLLVCTIASAQNINDALRYSSENIQGTARFQAMAGAFGALGGDLSALNSNPAGSAVFNNSLFTFTGSHNTRENDASYFNSVNTTKTDDLDLNQIGGVFVFKSTNQDSDWKKFSLAINYDVVRNFDERIVIAGNGTEGIDNYFLNFAQGLELGAIARQEGEFLEDAYLDIGANQGFADQQAFLGYYGGVIDPLVEEDSNTAYTRAADYSNVNQELLRTTSGFNNKFTLNAATQFKENLYLGASLNFHNVLYDRYDQFTEDGYNTDSKVQFVNFDNLLRTEGSGFSFSLGAIAKINDFIRLGGSYQSPTWYRLTDETSQRINSDSPDTDDDIGFIDFNVVNLFDAYTIKTPAKLMGSMAIVFGKNGLLSFDYGYQDMSQAELRPANDPSFTVVNSDITDNLNAVSSLRLGGEYRIERFSLRGGYRFEQSPYADGNIIGDLNGFSAGLGYNFGASRLDLAFNRTERDALQYLFDTGITTPARINRVNTSISLGYTLNF